MTRNTRGNFPLAQVLNLKQVRKKLPRINFVHCPKRPLIVLSKTASSESNPTAFRRPSTVRDRLGGFIVTGLQADSLPDIGRNLPKIDPPDGPWPGDGRGF